MNNGRNLHRSQLSLLYIQIVLFVHVSDFVEQAEMIPLYERVAAAFSKGESARDKSDGGGGDSEGGATRGRGDSWLVDSPEEGYERVAKEHYAFMWDDAILQWIAVSWWLSTAK